MIDQLLRDFVEFMDDLPPFPVLLAILVCVGPFLTLAHELGHALAALLLLPGRVVVLVGHREPLAAFELGRLTVGFHPLTVPGRFDGMCAYDPSGERRSDTALIALAGPAASLVTGLFAWSLLGAVPGGLVHDVVAVVVATEIFSVIVCLTPLTLTDSKGITLRTDGASALAALR